MPRDLGRDAWAMLRRLQGRATSPDPATTSLLLGYQQRMEQACERHEVVVVEKSRRTSATFGAAAGAVVRSASPRGEGGMDTLYMGTSHDMAREFVDACALWARLLDKAVSSVGEELFDDGSEHGIKAMRIDFASGFSIVALPPFKFIRHTPRSKMGVPLRNGVARSAAWAFMTQSFALKDWAAFSEVYGLPLRVGKYGPNASKDDIRTLLRAVRSIASDAAAVIPTGMDMEFVKVEGSHGASVFGELIGYTDKTISKIVVGQTMTADDGGSLAQAKVHNEVRIDILRADGKQTGATITRDLVLPFVSFNFGPQPLYPRVTFPVAEPEDITAVAGALAVLVPQGLKVSQGEVRNKLGFGDPEEDDELLVPPAAAAPTVPGTPQDRPSLPADRAKTPKAEDHVPPARAHVLGGDGSCPWPALQVRGHVVGCRCGVCLARRPGALSADQGDFTPDGLDETDALMASALDGWREMADPLLGPLLSAAAKATSFDEALALIARRGPDGSALLERLAIATAKARGIGDVMD